MILGLSGEDAVRDGYRTVLSRARAAHPNAHIEGVLVQAMARRGVEMILGVTRDPDYGPMLMVGLGGIHVEVLRDVAFAPVPLGREDAARPARRTARRRAARRRARRQTGRRDGAGELIVALSRFAADHADAIAEIDLNPVIVHPPARASPSSTR